MTMTIFASIIRVSSRRELNFTEKRGDEGLGPPKAFDELSDREN